MVETSNASTPVHICISWCVASAPFVFVQTSPMRREEFAGNVVRVTAYRNGVQYGKSFDVRGKCAPEDSNLLQHVELLRRPPQSSLVVLLTTPFTLANGACSNEESCWHSCSFVAQVCVRFRSFLQGLHPLRASLRWRVERCGSGRCLQL